MRRSKATTPDLDLGRPHPRRHARGRACARRWSLLWGLWACLFTVASARAQAPLEPGAVAVGSDGDVEIVPRSDVPLLGPAVAPVTIDVFIPFGHRLAGAEWTRQLALQAANADVRVRFHPVLGSDVAERGAELLLAVWRLVGARGASFLASVAAHPDWLGDSPDGGSGLGAGGPRDADADLLAAAAAHQIDVDQLRQSLRSRRYRPLATQLWTAARIDVRSPPEIWINGNRVRGSTSISDSALSEELEKQRNRAYRVLREGTPLGQLYEVLASTVDGAERSTPARVSATAGPFVSPWSTALSSPLSRASAGSSATMYRSGAVLRPGVSFAGRSRPAAGQGPPDLSGVPLRGPAVSPVTVVLIGNLEHHNTCVLARGLRDLMARYPDTVRFAFLPTHNLLPQGGMAGALVGDRGARVSLILAALALQDGAAFWRTYDAVLELMQRRYILSFVEFAQSILNQRIDFDRLTQQSNGEAVRAWVARTQSEATRLGVSSLPALFVNGRLVPIGGFGGGFGINPTSPTARDELLVRMIDAELHRGLLEKLRGDPHDPRGRP